MVRCHGIRRTGRGRDSKGAKAGLLAFLVAATVAHVPAAAATAGLPAPVAVPCKFLPCPTWEVHAGVTGPKQYAARGSVMVVRSHDGAAYGISTETAATLWAWRPPPTSGPQTLALAEHGTTGPAIVGVTSTGRLTLTALEPTTGEEAWSTVVHANSQLKAAVTVEDTVLVVRSGAPQDQWLRLNATSGTVLGQGPFPAAGWSGLSYNAQGNILWMVADGPGQRVCKVTGEGCLFSPRCGATPEQSDRGCILPPNPGGPAGGTYGVVAGLASYAYQQVLQPTLTEVPGGHRLLALHPATLATRWALDVPAQVGRVPMVERIVEHGETLLVAFDDAVELRRATDGALVWRVGMESVAGAAAAGGLAYIVQADGPNGAGRQRGEAEHLVHVRDLQTGAPVTTMTLHGQHFDRVKVFQLGNDTVVASGLVAQADFEETRHNHDAALHVFGPDGRIRWIARHPLVEGNGDDQVLDVRDVNGTLVSLSRLYEVGGTPGLPSAPALGLAAYRVQDIHAAPGADLASLLDGRAGAHVFLEPGTYVAEGSTRVKGASVCVQQVPGSCLGVVQEATLSTTGPAQAMVHHGWKDAVILLGARGWDIDARGERVQVEALVAGRSGLTVRAAEALLPRLAIATDAGPALLLRAERAAVSGFLAAPVAIHWERGRELVIADSRLEGDVSALQLDRLDGARAVLEDVVVARGSIHASQRVENTSVEALRVLWADPRCSAAEERWRDDGDGNTFVQGDGATPLACLAL
jgi:hypothetical protein